MRATNNYADNARFTAAYFKREDDLLAATHEAREAGFEIHDVYTPYAVHGLDEAMGLQRTRMGWIAFAAGAFGLLCGLVLQIWTSAYDWPLNVGGKPFNSFPLFIPVTFELTVLFSGLIAIGVLFMRNRLWLFNRRRVFERATDDLFVLVLRQPDASFDAERAAALLAGHHALSVIEGDQFV
ncbi:MAG: DUF3341 domain-containing protein [Blastocatellales bacterium]